MSDVSAVQIIKVDFFFLLAAGGECFCIVRRCLEIFVLDGTYPKFSVGLGFAVVGSSSIKCFEQTRDCCLGSQNFPFFSLRLINLIQVA